MRDQVAHTERTRGAGGGSNMRFTETTPRDYNHNTMPIPRTQNAKGGDGAMHKVGMGGEVSARSYGRTEASTCHTGQSCASTHLSFCRGEIAVRREIITAEKPFKPHTPPPKSNRIAVARPPVRFEADHERTYARNDGVNGGTFPKHHNTTHRRKRRSGQPFPHRPPHTGPDDPHPHGGAGSCHRGGRRRMAR